MTYLVSPSWYRKMQGLTKPVVFPGWMRPLAHLDANLPASVGMSAPCHEQSRAAMEVTPYISISSLDFAVGAELAFLPSGMRNLRLEAASSTELRRCP